MLDSSRAADRGIIRGIIEYSQGRGHWSFFRFSPLFRTFPFSQNRQDNLLERLNKLDADGIIGYLPTKKSLIQTIIQSNFPAVAIPVQDPISGILNVQQDKHVGSIGADHLLERGFEHLAFYGTRDYWSQIRQEGFIERIEQAGHTVRTFPIPAQLTKPAAALAQLADWLEKLPKPIGIMTSNDERSSDIVEACHMIGLTIPGQVAIIGVDNDEMICNLSTPPLSSIRLNPEMVGYKSAEAIDHLIAGKRVEQSDIFFEPIGIVTRQSTDILAIEDQQVAQAIRFIRNNARRDIHVNDVVNQSTLSIRALQQRFRKAIGRGINREIQRVRIRQLAEAIINTNQAIQQIAYDLEFNDINHVSRIFRREMGITPIGYRKHFGGKHL